MARMIICPNCGEEKEYHAKGMCKSCYGRQLPRRMIICVACDEEGKHGGKGMCSPCYSRQWHKEHPNHQKSYGPQNPNRIWRNRAWLLSRYIDEGLSADAIAREADTTGKTILEWLVRFGIEIRSSRHYLLGRKQGLLTITRRSRSNKYAWTSPELQEQQRRRAYRKWARPGEREAMSKRMKNEGNPMFNVPSPAGSGICERIIHRKPDGELVSLQGSWEERFARVLDARGIDWRRPARAERFHYIDANGEHKTYGPDFYVPAWDTYYEIKGYFGEKAQYKMEQVWANYPEIQLELVQGDLIEQIEVWAYGNYRS